MSDDLHRLRFFLCGDVMTGRGIDQILPFPSDPSLYEPFVKNAIEYVELAQSKNSNISYPVPFNYIWGDALSEFCSRKPDLRIINLETSITHAADYWKGKGINYRMNPLNFQTFIEAGIDCFTLANNHVLDWGYDGFIETLETIEKNGLHYCGAGRNIFEARKPLIIDNGEKGKTAIIAAGSPSSGIPPQWSADNLKPGVFLIDESKEESLHIVKDIISEYCGKNDVVIFSIHWGENWGYEIPPEQIQFAHNLIDKAGVTLVFGHSSHHAKPLELYNGKPIFYGSGDFINDYEGIWGYEEYRGDISCMYFVDINPKSRILMDVSIVPLQIKQFNLTKPDHSTVEWLRRILEKKSQKFHSRFTIENDYSLKLSL
jgi:poly-gamma-glutamate capsule biosynthesis protein CapA/YwtB (metallophosphatase superfamily)